MPKRPFAVKTSMSNPFKRYETLALKEGLSRSHLYPRACTELSFILREAYKTLPKNLQSIIFQDTLAAFRLLPQMHTRYAVSAAHLLLQSAEASLPKQKKNMAVSEFKHAKVAQKRRCKVQQVEEGTSELPQDVLVHLFSFLDMQSLVSVGLVCWSWNYAASNHYLWQSLYAIYFASNNSSLKTMKQQNDRLGADKITVLPDNMITMTSIDWKEAFKKAYIGNSSKRLTSCRGYCGQCKTIVWLDNTKCSNVDCGLQSKNQQIIPIASHQVVDYILNGCASIMCYSDGDSESEDELTPSHGPVRHFRRWSYCLCDRC